MALTGLITDSDLAGIEKLMVVAADLSGKIRPNQEGLAQICIDEHWFKEIKQSIPSKFRDGFALIGGIGANRC